jgi:hypothetical protein
MWGSGHLSAPRNADCVWYWRIALAMAIAAGGLGLGKEARADNVTVQLKAQESYEQDDNPLLLSNGATTLFGFVTQPEAIVNDDTPLVHLDLDSRLDINEFNEPHFNSTDAHDAFHSTYKGETTQFGIDGNVDYDTTRTSELTTSGINLAGIRHMGLTFSPHAVANLTPVDQALLNVSYNDTRYFNTRSYTNYSYLVASPMIQHSFDGLDIGSAGLQATEYATSEGPPISIYTVGPQFGWTRNFSQRLTATATAGAIATDSIVQNRAPGTGQLSYDYTYSLDLAFTGLQDTIHLTASRNPTPQGNGTESLQSSYGLTEKHSVTTRTDLSLSLQFITSEYAQKLNGTQQDFISISPVLTYHLTREWDVSSEFRYRRQDVVGGSVPGTSDAVLVHLVYTPSLMALGW